jgi:hypothetical protein
MAMAARRVRRWGWAAWCAVIAMGAVGCASGPVVVPVPSFPTSSPTSTSAPPTREAGHLLPADCEQLVGRGELSALFALPLDSVTVQTVQGTPSPSVGRLERVTCTYTVSRPAPQPVQGVALQMTIGTYQDAGAAHDQHERNVADQRAGASSSVEPDLGAAAAALVDHPAETVLLTSFDTITLDLDLTRRPGPLPPADLLTDLARRVLARLAPDVSDAQARVSP